MLSAKIERLEDYIVVSVKGTVGDTVDLESLIGFQPGWLKVNCKGIKGLTVEGVRRWIRFFMRQRMHGSTLEFLELPPCMVDLWTQLPQYFHFEDVHSVVVPFQCDQCGKNRYGRAVSEDIGRHPYPEISIKCKGCNQNMNFSGNLLTYKKFASLHSEALSSVVHLVHQYSTESKSDLTAHVFRVSADGFLEISKSTKVVDLETKISLLKNAA